MTLTNSINIDVRARKVKLDKNAYNSNKKEKFLFKYLSKSKYNFFAKLDVAPNSRYTITAKDIEIFLTDKNIQKQKITEEDVLAFLKKVVELNPTEQEIQLKKAQTKYKDKNNYDIMTPELKELFGMKTKEVEKNTYADENGNVNKGFEIFDLNGDTKIDELENDFIDNSYLTYSADIETLQKCFEKIDSTKDNIITKEEKELIYNELINTEAEKLKNLEIKDTKGENVVTPELCNLFNNTFYMSTNNLVEEENNNIKCGLEVFDLNKDGKFDNVERNFFNSNGKVTSKSEENGKINIKQLAKTIKSIDKFTYVKGYEQNMEDKRITDEDEKNLYKILSSAHYILDLIKDLPKELQEQYAISLKKIEFGDNGRKDAVGAHSGNTISISTKDRFTNQEINQQEIASIVFHELTHDILSKNTNMGAFEQEVICFYMEYKLNKAMKKDLGSDYYKKNDRSNIINEKYINYVDELKRKNPNISEKELAIKAFLEYNFGSYNGRAGYDKKTQEEIANYDYPEFYGIFKSVD